MNEFKRAFIDEHGKLTRRGKVGAGLLGVTGFAAMSLAPGGEPGQTGADLNQARAMKRAMLEQHTNVPVVALPENHKDLNVEVQEPKFHLKAQEGDNQWKLSDQLTDNPKDQAKVLGQLKQADPDGVIQPGQGFDVDANLVHPDPGTRFDTNGAQGNK